MVSADSAGLGTPILGHGLQILLQNISSAAVGLHLHIPALSHVTITNKGVLPLKGVHYGTNLQLTIYSLHVTSAVPGSLYYDKCIQQTSRNPVSLC